MGTALARAGADVFRLNFSHGSHDDHAAALAAIRAAEAELGRPLAALADLQGPKFRLGDFRDGRIAVAAGDRLRLDLDPALGDHRRVNLPHPDLLGALTPGCFLLIDDGKVRLRVLETGPDHADVEVIQGDELSNHKGVS